MITAEGCLYEIRMGYAGVGVFRIKLAQAFNEDFGQIYEKFIRSAFPSGEPLTEKEEEKWDAIMKTYKNGKVINKFFTEFVRKAPKFIYGDISTSSPYNN